MDSVETVALWVGLIAGVVSVVLALVAMVFTFVVDRRSSSINEQMIKSLQKIETSVERVADDTTNLIKVAWERLLPGTVDERDEAANDELAISAITAGVAAELRSELSAPGDAEVFDRLDEAVGRLERTLQAQLSAGARSARSTRTLPTERIYDQLNRVSPRAREVIRALLSGGRHLTREEYRALRRSSLSRAIGELREYALLVPLRAAGADDDDAPVYYFPPSSQEFLPTIMGLFEPASGPIREQVKTELAGVGYSSDQKDS